MTKVLVQLAKPLNAVKVMDNYVCVPAQAAGGEQAENPKPDPDAEVVRLNQELKAQIDLYNNVCQTLQKAANELNHIYEQIYSTHSEGIAKLSVEIARKILMQKTSNGEYEIESMIKEIIKNAPSQQDLIVRLSPQDFEQCQKIQSEGKSFDGIKFAADENVGNAECVLESPKGVIKSLIEEHLEEIGKALANKN